MKSGLGTLFSVTIALCVWGIPTARGDNQEGGQFHFDLGLSYVSGVQKVDNALKSEVEASGDSFSSFAVPVGVQFDPYYLFDFGLGIGGCVGPTEIISVSDFPGSSDYSLVVPVGLDARYEFLTKSDIVPYVRGGFRYPITSGDALSHGQAGVFGGGGVEFTSLHLGLEASYDSSTVDVNFNGLTQRVKPSEFMVTLYFHF